MENRINPADVPKRKLYTGEEIPAVGIGTFGSDKYSPQQVSDAVYGAILSGYRLIDCASVYQNEDRIGEVIHKALAETATFHLKVIFLMGLSSVFSRTRKSNGSFSCFWKSLLWRYDGN